MYELERSRADALTIEGLHRDLAALIHDKRQLSEENLRLRSTVAGMPTGKKALAERVAELEGELARARRDGVGALEGGASAVSGRVFGDNTGRGLVEAQGSRGEERKGVEIAR